LKHIQEVLPRDCVEGFGDVKLQKQCGSVIPVIVFCQVLDIEKVVLNASSGDEGMNPLSSINTPSWSY
jgi:hypothetical protein